MCLPVELGKSLQVCHVHRPPPTTLIFSFLQNKLDVVVCDLAAPPDTSVPLCCQDQTPHLYFTVCRGWGDSRAPLYH